MRRLPEDRTPETRPVEIIDAQEAKTRPTELLDRVAEGEEFVIAKAGRPVARLVAVRERVPDRAGGQWKGSVRMGDDFDDPLPVDEDRQHR